MKVFFSTLIAMISVMLVVLGSSVMIGCGKDKATAADSSIAVPVVAIAKVGLGRVVISITTASSDTNVLGYELYDNGGIRIDSIGKTATAFDTILIADITHNDTFTVNAVGAGNWISADVVVVYTADGITALTIDTATLGAESHATLGSSYSISTATAYLLADAKTNCATIDIIYNTTGGLYSPLAAATANLFSAAASRPSTWTTQNDTKFKTTTLDAADFAAVTASEECEYIYENVASATEVSTISVAQGDVVAVLTADGTYALILIETQVAGATGTISIKAGQ